MSHKCIKIQGGFALIEMIVAVGLFSVIIVAAGGIFQLIAVSQRNTIAAQNIQEAFRYALEVMGKEIRNAQPNDGTCGSISDGLIYAQNSSADLMLKNKNNQCVRYYLSGGRIHIERAGDDFPVTPSAVAVTDMKFIISQADGDQPSITFYIEGYVEGQANAREEIKIQTSISSRHYN